MRYFSTCSLSAAMVHILLALHLLAFRLPAVAQAPAWQSARVVAVAPVTVTAGNRSEVKATAVDAVGNVYVAGVFRNTVVLGGTTLTSLGDFDVFVAKFSPVSNQFVWAQRAGGTSEDQVTALVVNGSSVYVAGYFNSPTVGFGTISLTSAGINNIFVAKLTDAGSTSSFTWAQRAGGTGNDLTNALAVSGSNVYIAGSFNSPTASFGTTTLTNSGGANIYVAKLIDAGSTSSFIWSQRAGGSGLGVDASTALAVSGSSVYVAGTFTSPTAGFGTTTLTNAVSGYPDIFVAKLTDAGSTGSFTWAQRAGGIDSDNAYALAVSGSSIYVAGYFASSTASFGTTTLTSTGAGDIYVAKLTDAGNTGSFTWVQRAGGTSSDDVYALAVSGSSVYVAGSFAGIASFGTTTLLGGTASDAYVAKLTDAGSTGSFLWAQQAGGTGVDASTALAVSGSSVYVAGTFAGPTASFGTTILANPYPGYPKLGFLASLADATLTATAAGRTLVSTQLYPNPAHRTATLRLPAGATPAPLVLTDALGRTVRHYPTPASYETALDLEGLPNGLYLLHGTGPAQRLMVE